MISPGDYIENTLFPGSYGKVITTGDYDIIDKEPAVTYHIKGRPHYNVCKITEARVLNDEEVALLILKGVL